MVFKITRMNKLITYSKVSLHFLSTRLSGMWILYWYIKFWSRLPLTMMLSYSFYADAFNWLEKPLYVFAYLPLTIPNNMFCCKHTWSHILYVHEAIAEWILAVVWKALLLQSSAEDEFKFLVLHIVMHWWSSSLSFLCFFGTSEWMKNQDHMAFVYFKIPSSNINWNVIP